MSFRTIQAVLASAVANGGTFTVSYPPGTSRSTFLRANRHVIRANNATYVSPTNFTVSLGASVATITWNVATTLPAGSAVAVQLDAAGPETYREMPPLRRPRANVSDMFVRLVNLGNPAAGSSTAIAASQGVGAGAAAVLTAAPYAMDFARNVVAAWTGTSVLTVTGLDVYGNVMVESSASGTSMTGAKAFASVTSAVFSAAVTAATIGTGNVLGIPIYLQNAQSVLREFQDAAAPTAGTLVAGLSVGTRSTATTADVRGTYTPNATPNGSIVFELLIATPDPNFFGNPQFAG